MVRAKPSSWPRASMSRTGPNPFLERLVLICEADHPPVRGPQDVAGRAVFTFRRSCAYRTRLETWFSHERVAMGRAIVRDAAVYLMDEPLSNLDAKLRVSMRTEISKLHREMGATTIYVTHDQVEAMTMADRIVIMKDGVIQQVGKPMDLYEHPVNKFVAGFIGSPQMNFYDVKVDGKKLIFADGNTVELPEAIAKRIAGYSEVIMGIRGEDIKFDTTNLDVYGSHQKAVIDNTEIMGNENNLYFDFGGSVTIARVSKYEVSQVGDEVEFTFMPHKMHFFDKETEQVIGAE